MKVFIGADHRGFRLKEELKRWLTGLGHEVVDCGNTVYDKDDDYPDFSFAVAEAVSSECRGSTSQDRLAASGSTISAPGSLLPCAGIVVCGSGVGVTIAANKVAGIRCSTASCAAEVKCGREDDDLNVLAISADYGSGKAREFINVFLSTPFVGRERYIRRLKKIEERERKTVRRLRL